MHSDILNFEEMTALGLQLRSLKWGRLLPLSSSFFLPYPKEDKLFCVFPVATVLKKTTFTYSFGALTL
jgi:hypothetical protein